MRATRIIEASDENGVRVVTAQIATRDASEVYSTLAFGVVVKHWDGLTYNEADARVRHAELVSRV